MGRHFFTFKKGGVHPEGRKDTAEMAIEPMPVPAELAVILGQHIGKPCDAVVSKGDEVEEGQLLGEVHGGLGTGVHAPCAGKIVKIGTAGHPVKIGVPAIILKPVEAGARAYEKCDWSELTSEEMLHRINAAGVIGAGGAGFPTHVKLSPPPRFSITDLVINGAECEPYLTSDHRVMLEHSAQVVDGIRILMAVLNVKRALVGIEDNKPDAIGTMRKASEGVEGIEICPLKTKYPQGSEKQMIFAMTGRRIGSGELPASVGVVVQNVSTAFAVYEAVALQKPMTERIITVSGNGIRRRANLSVKVGTRIRDIVGYLGGMTPDVKKVIMGGPMMGFATSDLDTPVTKTTSGLLFLTAEEVDLRAGGPCIRCGWCLNACPMGLEPKEIALYVEAGRGADTAQFGVMDCFECGSCAYVCPAKRPLVQMIRLAKQAVRRKGKK